MRLGVVAGFRLQRTRMRTSALRFARRKKLPLAEATTGEAWRDESFGGTLAFARVTRAECSAADLTWINMSKLVAPKIRNCKLSEQIVEDRGRVLDRLVAAHRACRLEAREGEGIDELFQRNAILQTDGHRDRKVVHERAEGGAFLMHVDKDLAQTTVCILASP